MSTIFTARYVIVLVQASDRPVVSDSEYELEQAIAYNWLEQQ